jgi:hypothetical protein
MKNTFLPNPPDLIKITSNYSARLDLRKPVHARAYLLAAGRSLSGWPQDWSAERLALALLAEEGEDAFEDQKMIRLWDGLTSTFEPDKEDFYFLTECTISDIAEEILEFLTEVAGASACD